MQAAMDGSRIENAKISSFDALQKFFVPWRDPKAKKNACQVVNDKHERASQ
jgi:hypothetical protein